MKDWSINTILVPVGDVEQGQQVLEAALGLARRFQAHLRVWHVAVDPTDSLFAASMKVPAGMRATLIEASQQHAAEVTKAARALFDEFCSANDVQVLERPPAPNGVSASWHSETGKESAVVTSRGRLADLIVLPRPLSPTPAPETLESALFGSSRPVLLVPPSPPQTIGTVTAIAWNGSQVAARALTGAKPFLGRAERVVVLAPADGSTESLSAQDLIDELAWHDVAAEIRTFTERGSIGETLLTEARAAGADLLVMGGFGKTRVREMILGGATRHVMANADLPVLMAH